MFRPMRRGKQQLRDGEALEVLRRGTSGVLGLIGDEGYPYTVPVSYACHEGKIYIHGAKSGHKLDAVKGCDKASFCVIDRDEVIAEKLTSAYRSVIAFGRIRILESEEERVAAARIIGLKYYADAEAVEHEIQSTLAALCCFELEIEHLSGKEGLELTRLRASGRQDGEG